MKNKLIFLLITSTTLASAQTKSSGIVSQQEVARILNTLTADEMHGRAAYSPDIEKAADFISTEFKQIGLKPFAGGEYRQTFTSKIKPDKPLFNVVGVLPGISKPDEYVIFSAHYDHIGIIKPVGQDSIANGADDDASGVSAVISLARYYARRHDNARSLLFVTFTAEELGLVGSSYFTSQINPDQVVAMINIEMIGKDSKFGPNSVFVTGFDRSDLATIMQKNVEGTDFTFHPDPYPAQKLFYRSDNATLAAQGVPAHSFSTDQIDTDSLYHSVKDEVSSLNVGNIVASIQAIAIGAQSIVSGKDTPSRVPKLKKNP
ncbi:Peptidase family M28 [bacterium A37T11]|nr:Peptidase family M28 [bacterium A37T11]